MGLTCIVTVTAFQVCTEISDFLHFLHLVRAKASVNLSSGVCSLCGTIIAHSESGPESQKE